MRAAWMTALAKISISKHEQVQKHATLLGTLGDFELPTGGGFRTNSSSFEGDIEYPEKVFMSQKNDALQIDSFVAINCVALEILEKLPRLAFRFTTGETLFPGEQHVPEERFHSSTVMWM